MKAVDILIALRGHPVTAADLHAFAASLGVELARGRLNAAALVKELAWVEVDEDAAEIVGYRTALVDLVRAFVTEWTLVAARAGDRIDDPLGQRLLAAMIEHGEPITSAELAKRIGGVHPSTVHRRLARLMTDGFLATADATNGKEKPYALTRRALAARSVRDDARDPASGERRELEACVRRRIEQIEMQPHERTLYLALLHWAGTLFEQPAWSDADLVVARSLRRTLLALGQPASAPIAALVAEDSHLLDVLVRYCDLRHLVDKDIDFETELADAEPPEDHPARLAWAIAAVRVAYSLDVKSYPDPGATAALRQRLSAAATATLATRPEPLAILWRDPEAEAEVDLLRAPLGFAPTNPVVENLETSRMHLTVVNRSNRLWRGVDCQLAVLWKFVLDAIPHLQTCSEAEQQTWCVANGGRLRKHIHDFMSTNFELEICIDRYVRGVNLESEAKSVPTIPGDANLYAYQRLCAGLLACAPSSTERTALRSRIYAELRRDAERSRKLGGVQAASTRRVARQDRYAMFDDIVVDSGSDPSTLGGD